MGLYSYIKKTLEKQYSEKSPEYKAKVRAWRNSNIVSEIDAPSNLSRARALGYKAKEGYFLVRIRIGKGLRAREEFKRGRKPRHNYKFKAPGLSYQAIAEQRVGKKYPALEVLNSYWVGEDGQFKYFEIILVDPILANVNLQIARVFRGLTSAGKKARALSNKGTRSNKMPK